jgi:uncharacterized protein YbjT (DUF2867 family)
MYVITGITGKVGGVVARTLLSKNLPVRGVMRNAAKAGNGGRLGVTSRWLRWMMPTLWLRLLKARKGCSSFLLPILTRRRVPGRMSYHRCACPGYS